MKALNQAGATQAQAVTALTRVVANSGRELVPGTLAGSPGTIVLAGVQAGVGSVTPVVTIASNGVATYGSAVVQSFTRTAVIVKDFLPK